MPRCPPSLATTRRPQDSRDHKIPTVQATENTLVGILFQKAKAKEPSPNSFSPDAALLQVAARPPPAPKAERRKPTVKPTKAAITVTNGVRAMFAIKNSNIEDMCGCGESFSVGS
ncbi:uncharacterized protein B0H18DRAFT_1208925 [Fomitopsis serialis]|uniref:uncharacterized protein n=1 Tax=Fomitopsis serialis TaxID=139415 RepID=UPI0020077E1B|nr:uncharacterized protein B0H18DRAFT_1208925 [Neoantrodia serialis]KAH9931236.1 hypothetical protein B0H18DRAFT_1208925 [Neoantrodia serialis]